ncbi:hypothetical protein PGB90_006455 [Kerria lacca]
MHARSNFSKNVNLFIFLFRRFRLTVSKNIIFTPRVRAGRKIFLQNKCIIENCTRISKTDDSVLKKL